LNRLHTLTRIALAGRFVAAAISTIAKEPPDSLFIYRVNAATGRRDAVNAAPARENEFGEHARGVTDITVTPAGTVAWIVGGTADMPSQSRVFEWPPGSKVPVVLASSPEIVPASLASRPGRLYWTEGEPARSASIK
jgi:hypothetical protein